MRLIKICLMNARGITYDSDGEFWFYPESGLVFEKNRRGVNSFLLINLGDGTYRAHLLEEQTTLDDLISKDAKNEQRREDHPDLGAGSSYKKRGRPRKGEHGAP